MSAKEILKVGKEMRKKAAEFVTNHLSVATVHLKKIPLRLKPEAHQLTNTTRADRYPDIFKGIQKEFGDREVGHILSYGCSTGEECLALKKYFPTSKVTGTDINPRNLKKCRKNIADPTISFVYSEIDQLRVAAPYNIILCMSVLCRWEDTKYVDNCHKIYPFEKFQNQINDLDSILAPGGLLVIYNSNFRFHDTFLAHRYQAVQNDHLRDSGFVDKFDSNNNKIDNDYPYCIFRKLS